MAVDVGARLTVSLVLTESLGVEALPVPDAMLQALAERTSLTVLSLVLGMLEASAPAEVLAISLEVVVET